MQRTLTANTTKKINEQVKLLGWVNKRRDHGKVIFIDLRDRSGIAQVVISSSQAKESQGKKLSFERKKAKFWGIDELSTIRSEDVVEVEGKVVERSEKAINLKIPTGKIEIQAQKIKVLAKAKELPFPINTDGYEIKEELRLKYRYLDIRRPRITKNLKLRHKVIKFIRDFLDERDFTEIETPILTKSTPEGARDFVVPSRLQPGKFYALPQSPQQYKQLLMVAGLEKYYQIARCFRDEDPRADRAYGEFTQLDLEMSFVTQKEILKLTEELFSNLVKKIFPRKKISQIPFPILTHQEVMKKYGTDKPDLRKDKKNPDELAFCFVVDWPLFEETEEREIGPAHHPFTAPKEEDIALLNKGEIKKVRSYQHDLVLNGYEVGGGSVRITDPKLQTKIFEILGHTKQEIQQKFGHLLEAFQYGVPPHGGIAPGIDRLIMAALGEPSLREVIAFPMTSGGRTSIMSAPSELDSKQLKELGIKIK
ncbi:aspartate--tRNA ligase [Candidatus Microgenomates bacterium]|nr:aspartate--tRNA ligase [Candidatus Microgenomates bacterium]